MSGMVSEAAWQERIAAARKRGDHFDVYDLATQALARWPDAVRFDHEAIMALARAGAFRHARKRYDRLVADNRLALATESGLSEDLAALDGRLWKDLAQRSTPEDAQHFYQLAADAYAVAFSRFNRPYAAINAASMFLAVGQCETARHYAQLALSLSRLDPEDDYYRAATEAEAFLILGDHTDAAKALHRASTLGRSDLDRLATTRKQLSWLVPLAGAQTSILDALVMPRVLTWNVDQAAQDFDLAGHFPSKDRIVAVGPILSAGDVFVALALISIGADVTIVLPCDPALILPTLSGSQECAHAFDSVLNDARQVLRVTDEGGPFEPAAYLLCRQQAIGLARLRAAHLATAPKLLRLKRSVTIEPLPLWTEAECSTTSGDVAAARTPHVILFGDVRGFSSLSESEQLLFVTSVIGEFGAVLDAYPSVAFAETAGDGLFVVMADVRSAVQCAFALQEVLVTERIVASGLPGRLGLRLSMHIGPLYRRFDRVIKREKFCGVEVIRTARIEPVTPVGDIFVTEQFAAVLATVSDDYWCEYAGVQPMAKNYGECRMYSLQRVHSPAQSSLHQH
jgi:adenylate cyclase